MTLTHLLDTDVAIDVLRQRSAAARERLAALGSSVGVSTVTRMELEYGALRSRDRRGDSDAVAAFLGLTSEVPLDAAAASHAADIRAELAALGTPIGAYDLLIAGVARSRGLLLITGNVREFQRVSGLTVEAWRTSGA